MKLNRSMLAAVAMILSAATALGCNPKNKSADDEAFVAAPPAATAPVAETPAATTDESVKVAAKVQIPAPPALRTETPSRSPSAKHRWSAGFWRYDTGRSGYAWVPGHWELRDGYAPYAPPAPRYEDRRYSPGRGYVFIAGSWSWTGRAYVWTPGHYESRRAGYRYTQPRWEQDNGRGVRRDGYWAARPAGERGKHKPGQRASAPKPSGGHAGNHGGQTGNHQTGNHGGGTAQAPAPAAQAPAATRPAMTRTQTPMLAKPSLTPSAPPKPSKLVAAPKLRPAPPKAEAPAAPKTRTAKALPAAGRAM